MSDIKKILIADDDPSIVDALQIMLEDAGYDVKTTVNGETVFQMMDEQPDLLLLDISMSGIDGRDVCRDLKKNERTRHIPIIIISANKDTAQIAKEAGADDFITKPFEMDVLLEKVEKHTSNK
ncbi:MAG: response regulator [bacterium]|nr:response regulator [bacterium]